MTSIQKNRTSIEEIILSAMTFFGFTGSVLIAVHVNPLVGAI